MAETDSTAAIEAMSKLVLESFNGPFETIAAELEKLEQSQLGWLSRIDVENSKFLQTDQALKEAIVFLQQVPGYTTKLQSMKKEMAVLQTQTKSLLTATAKLKEKRQKEVQDRIEKDRMLLAQPAEPAPSNAAPPAYASTSKPLSTPL